MVLSPQFVCHLLIFSNMEKIKSPVTSPGKCFITLVRVLIELFAEDRECRRGLRSSYFPFVSTDQPLGRSIIALAPLHLPPPAKDAA
jgi:hypothetical protein